MKADGEGLAFHPRLQVEVLFGPGRRWPVHVDPHSEPSGHGTKEPQSPQTYDRQDKKWNLNNNIGKGNPPVHLHHDRIDALPGFLEPKGGDGIIRK